MHIYDFLALTFVASGLFLYKRKDYFLVTFIYLLLCNLTDQLDLTLLGHDYYTLNILIAFFCVMVAQMGTDCKWCFNMAFFVSMLYNLALIMEYNTDNVFFYNVYGYLMAIITAYLILTSYMIAIYDAWRNYINNDSYHSNSDGYIPPRGTI